MRLSVATLVSCDRHVMAVTAAVFFLAWPAAAGAATMTYTSLANWTTATRGEGWLVDFSAFGSDTEFRTTAVDAGPFSLDEVGGNNFRNLIDVPPFESSEGDTTTLGSLWVEFGSTTIDMMFDGDDTNDFGPAVSAWGGVLFLGSAGAGALEIALYSPTNVLLGTLSVPDGFFGFTSSDPVGMLRFQSRSSIPGGIAFGLDDVRGAPAQATPVPEPGPMSLFAVGLAGLGVRRWRPPQS